MSVNGRRVLYIGLDYYRLPKLIVDEIENQGGICVFLPIKRRDLQTIASSRLFHGRFESIQTHYHESIIQRYSNQQWDVVFFIQIHHLTEAMIRKYRVSFKGASFILYNWDSLEQHDYTKYIDYFDQVFSFDRLDTERNRRIVYQPLFFGPDIGRLSSIVPSKKHGLQFTGTFNQLRRYQILKRIITFCANNDIEFTHKMSVSWTRYLREIAEHGNMLNPKLVTFNAVSPMEYISLFRDNGFVVDIPNNSQSGLSFRVIESIGSNRKLITFNSEIVKEPFYDPDLVFVVEGEQITEVIQSEMVKFIQDEYKPFKYRFVEKYFLAEWIRTIFDVC